jgi:osmoprotectant transport system substrate-binding protein
MRARTRIIAPLALAVALTAACGESGSSGTGGDARRQRRGVGRHLRPGRG